MTQSLSLPRVCVSALSGGGGKTLLSLGLCRAFARAGLTVQPFKKGPDYIDAAWLSLAAGRSAGNLDPFFLSPQALTGLFVEKMCRTAREAGLLSAQNGIAAGIHDHRQDSGEDKAQPHGSRFVALLEGNRGLFDGLDVQGSCATAGVARMLACPVILSVDCTKMTRTTAALLQGIVHFEQGLHFGGVVLNQLGSARHGSLVRRCVEEYTSLPVLGALPRLKENPLPERHMGISSAGDGLSDDAEERLEALASLIEAHVDVDKVLDVARAALPVAVSPDGGAQEPAGAVCTAGTSTSASTPASTFVSTAGHTSETGVNAACDTRPVRIGYVRDAALWFYYEENLQALRDAGAVLVRLSALEPADLAVWRGLDGVYLGGGFPEDFVQELSTSPVLPVLAELAARQMPIYAECGGVMLLARGLEVRGKNWPMSGFLPLQGQFTGQPQGLGYVQGTVRAANPYYPLGMDVRGHEFHFSRCVWQGKPPVHALRLHKGTGMGRLAADATDAIGGNGDGFVCGRVWASYCHIFAPAVPCWAVNFVRAARQYRAEQAGQACTQGGKPCACL